MSISTHTAPATSLVELERRLEALEAEQAIRALMGAYVAARDRRRDGAEIAALFAPDGIWEGTGPYSAQLGRHQGREAIARRFSANLPATLHVIGGEQIDVDGHHATGRWHYLAPAVIDGDAAWMGGRYHNDFVRHDGRWRFGHVRVEPTLAAAHATGWGALIEPHELGKRASE